MTAQRASHPDHRGFSPSRSPLGVVRIPPILASLGLFWVASCATTLPTASAPDPCKDVELQEERVWSASIKAQVMTYGVGIDANTRQSIVNKMDDISEDWVRLRLAVCNDFHKRQVIGNEEYERQVKCFDEKLEQQRRLVTLLKADPSSAGKLATELLDGSSACK